jgi:hypothetical protein
MHYQVWPRIRVSGSHSANRSIANDLTAVELGAEFGTFRMSCLSGSPARSYCSSDLIGRPLFRNSRILKLRGMIQQILTKKKRSIACGSRWALSSIVITASTLAAHAEGPPAGTVEVKKTVDTLVGHWVLTGTDMEPGAKASVPAKLTMDCAPTALRKAVSCQVWVELGSDHIEATFLIGYNPDEQVVRWMEIASSGEYHDHRGHWNGDQIEFEPLRYTISGVKMTEYFTAGFPSPGKTKWKWTVEASHGNQIVEMTGSRS